jgi:site-specific recombinase
MSEEQATPPRRRLNFLLTEEAYQDIQDLASKSQRSITDLVRRSVEDLVRVIVEAARNRHRMVIVDSNGHAVREIVLPSLAGGPSRPKQKADSLDSTVPQPPL